MQGFPGRNSDVVSMEEERRERRKREEIDEKEERIAVDALLTLGSTHPWVEEASSFFSERHEAAMILLRLVIRGER